QHSGRDQPRATTADEDSVRLQQLQRPRLQVLVAAQRLLDGVLAARELRRVEDDQAKALAAAGAVVEVVEDVGFVEGDVQAVEPGVFPCQRQGGLGGIDA